VPRLKKGARDVSAQYRALDGCTELQEAQESQRGPDNRRTFSDHYRARVRRREFSVSTGAGAREAGCHPEFSRSTRARVKK
jgi:hypothetical protein